MTACADRAMAEGCFGTGACDAPAGVEYVAVPGRAEESTVRVAFAASGVCAARDLRDVAVGAGGTADWRVAASVATALVESVAAPRGQGVAVASIAGPSATGEVDGTSPPDENEAVAAKDRCVATSESIPDGRGGDGGGDGDESREEQQEEGEESAEELEDEASEDTVARGKEEQVDADDEEIDNEGVGLSIFRGNDREAGEDVADRKEDKAEEETEGEDGVNVANGADDAS